MAHLTRTCIGCNQEDDHPRIVVASTVPHADITWHHDCWVIAHPDDGTDPGVTEMHAIVKHAAGKQGDALREHLLSPEHRKLKAKFEAEAEARHPGVTA